MIRVALKQIAQIETFVTVDVADTSRSPLHPLRMMSTPAS